MTTLSRRTLLLGAATLPWGFAACVQQRAETPLAHLYGKQWVHGAYSYFAKTYADIQQGADERSGEAYRVLAQKGVTALSALQSREVPFYIQVADGGERFLIQRQVPERLTFTADMTEAERQEATFDWKLARDHIQTDYVEITRLDKALTGLLLELRQVRNAEEQGQLEQYKLARQLGDIEAGGALPFQLPYKVHRDDYRIVLYLLLERLESDRKRLRRIESGIISVGLVARATDANSASLAQNIQKVLLAVANDPLPPAESLELPEQDDRHEKMARARKLRDHIVKTEGYKTWLAAQKEREDEIGRFLTVLDQMTGLHTSRIYRSVMHIWNGRGDYLSYLKIAASLVPSGSGLDSVLETAIDTTEKARKVIATAEHVEAVAKQAADEAENGELELKGEALINVASKRARGELDKQLVFYRDKAEQTAVDKALGATKLMQGPLPAW